MSSEDAESEMHKRRITLPDGRYLIFYTFEDQSAAPASASEEDGAERPEPEPLPDAEEERRV